MERDLDLQMAAWRLKNENVELKRQLLMNNEKINQSDLETSNY